jgi:hypothetical protein
MKKVLILSLLTILSACASNKVLTKENINKLKGASISFEKEDVPPFSVTKAGATALFGPLSIPSQFYTGKKLISENNLPTPANLIAEKALKSLENKYNIKSTDSKDANFKLDFESSGMGLLYRFSAIYYDFQYSTKIKLIDQKQNSTIGEYLCTYHSKKETGDSYKYKEFTKDNAKLLKSMIDNIATKCSKEFIETIFKTN